MGNHVNYVSLIKVLEVAGLDVKLGLARFCVTCDAMLVAIPSCPGTH